MLYAAGGQFSLAGSRLIYFIFNSLYLHKFFLITWHAPTKENSI
jgi:hypothetical protein